RRVAELLTTALGSAKGDREEEGLAALREAAQLDRTLAEHNGRALAHLQSRLAAGAGTNAFNRRQLPLAVQHYITELASLLILDRVTDIPHSLRYLQDVALRFRGFEYAATFKLVRALANLANDIEVIAGTAGAE